MTSGFMASDYPTSALQETRGADARPCDRGGIRLSRLSILLVVALLSPLAAATVAAPDGAIAGARSRYAAFEGAQVHYKLVGERGPALVLVHGWACNLGFWGGQAPLAAQARLLLVDLPGHGRSDKPDVAYTIPRFARAVEAVMRDAGIERAVLAGHSMGTAVVWQFSRLYPARTQALIAVDGSFRSYVSGEQQRRKYAARYNGPGFEASMRAVVDGIAGDTPPAPLREWIRAQALETPQHVVASAAYEMSDPAVFASEPAVKVPVLAIYAASAFWSAEYRKAIEAFIPELDYRTIDGVGHFLMLEKPDAVNQLVLGFLGERGLLAP